MANSRAEKSLSVMSNSKASQWCYVNVDNEFEFMGEIFVIDDSVEEYKVHNKAKDVYDFTNEAYMEEILVVLYNDNTIKFYNQNFDEIRNDKILVKS